MIFGRKKYKRTFKSDLVVLADLRGFVYETLQETGCDLEHIQSVEMAAHEAGSNIIRHAYRQEPGRNFSMEISVGRGEIRVVLEDQGQPLQAAVYDKGRLDAMTGEELTAREQQRGGLGLYLIAKMMDRLETSRSGPKNVLEMVKRLD